MSDIALQDARPGRVELDRRSVEVLNCALGVACGDLGLIGDGERAPDVVAQDIAVQYLLRHTEPMSLRGWAATATRYRLMDLANHTRPVAVEDSELFRRMEQWTGHREGVNAREHFRMVIAALGPVEQSVINEHFTGATDEQINRTHGYSGAGEAAAIVTRIKGRLQDLFPEMRFGLSPERVAI
ncbi:hypothetical protein [Pengzhenrongella sp.]|jgi:hypothetical protein|uniref:hypothetical protein n=1 Tax=Pengzhenrongella sp. TaxID=2888820 RepID=UPI002F91DE51